MEKRKNSNKPLEWRALLWSNTKKRDWYGLHYQRNAAVRRSQWLCQQRPTRWCDRWDRVRWYPDAEQWWDTSIRRLRQSMQRKLFERTPWKRLKDWTRWKGVHDKNSRNVPCTTHRSSFQLGFRNNQLSAAPISQTESQKTRPEYVDLRSANER